MALPIQKDDVASIATIKSLTPAALEELIQAIASVPLMSDIEAMMLRIARGAPSLKPEQVVPVLDTLSNFYYVRELSGVSSSRFLGDILAGIQQNPDLAVPASDFSKLRSRLAKLLDIENFGLLAKALRLQRDGERLFCDGKILSDIRPVFGSKVTPRPAGAVVTHTLRIGYHEGKDHKEFDLMVETDDLEALSKIISRAMAKDKVLRNLIASAKLPDLGTK